MTMRGAGGLLLIVAAAGLVAASCGGAPTVLPSTTATTVATSATTTTAPTTSRPTTTGQSTTSTSTTGASSSGDESTTSLPPGATAGLDDYDGDGEPDPTCGTQDFGGDLVLRIPCEIGTSNEPPNGTTLVKDSLFRMPGSTDIDLSGISGSLILARDVAGKKVVLVTFNSDGLFETGSAEIAATGTFDNTVTLINSMWPGSAVQVRGHTDATGSAAGNQSLSEERATAGKDYLTSHGLKASEVTAVGFGSSRPLAEETNPDGSANEEGQLFNRRVEIVLRVP
jgi:outer membrane protein OmpA-like peptidoglycan-associated protein